MTSWYSTPAQSSPSRTWSKASGRRGLSSDPIVSSKTRRSLPWYFFAYASFRTNARAFPICRGPLGYGAGRDGRLLEQLRGDRGEFRALGLRRKPIHVRDDALRMIRGFAGAGAQGGVLREHPSEDRLGIRLSFMKNRILQGELSRGFEAHGRPNRGPV